MKAIQRCVGITVLGLLLVLPVAQAQRVIQGDLQTQMSPEQFRAAGLDKLSTGELASLNAWLQGKVEQAVEQATAQVVAEVQEKAREEGRQEVITKNRGFLSFGSDEPIVSTLQGEFRGFQKGLQFTLDNGQVWEQTDSATLHGVRRTNPGVRITPGVMGVWYFQVDGANTRAKVKRIK